MSPYSYDFEAAKTKLNAHTRRLSDIIDASIADPTLKKEFWKLIASRRILNHQIESSRARMAFEDLLAAPSGTIPHSAKTFLNYDPDRPPALRDFAEEDGDKRN